MSCKPFLKVVATVVTVAFFTTNCLYAESVNHSLFAKRNLQSASNCLAASCQIEGVVGSAQILGIGLVSFREFLEGNLTMTSAVRSPQDIVAKVAKKAGIKNKKDLDEKVAWLPLGEGNDKVLYVFFKDGDNLIYIRFAPSPNAKDPLQCVLSGYQSPLEGVKGVLPNAEGYTANRVTEPFIVRGIFGVIESRKSAGNLWKSERAKDSGEIKGGRNPVKTAEAFDALLGQWGRYIHSSDAAEIERGLRLLIPAIETNKLIELLSHRLPIGKQIAAEELGNRVGTFDDATRERVISALLQRLGDPDVMARINISAKAREVLNKLGVEKKRLVDRYIEILENGKEDSEYYVKNYWYLGSCIEAINELGDLGDSRVVEPIIGVLKRVENRDFKHNKSEFLHQVHLPIAVAKALGKLKDERGIKALIGILSQSRIHDVTFAAVRSLIALAKAEIEGLLRGAEEGLSSTGARTSRRGFASVWVMLAIVGVVSAIIIGLMHISNGLVLGNLGSGWSFEVIIHWIEKNPGLGVPIATIVALSALVLSGVVFLQIVFFLTKVMRAVMDITHDLVAPVRYFRQYAASPEREDYCYDDDTRVWDIKPRFGRTRSAKTIEILKGLLLDKERKVREEARKLLVEFGVVDEELLDTYLGGLESQNADIVLEAIKFFSDTNVSTKRDELINKLLPLLKNWREDWYGKNEGVFVETGKLLQKLGAKELLAPVLKELLSRRDKPFVVEESILMLGRLGIAEYADCIMPFLIDAKHTFRSAAKRALQNFRIETSTYARWYCEGIRNPDPGVRADSARELGELKDSDLIVPLLAVLLDPDYTVRRSVREALGKLGAQDEQLVEVYLKGLESKDAIIKTESAEFFARVKDGRVVKPLIKMLKDARVGSAPVKSLGEQGNSSAVVPLRKLKERLEKKKGVESSELEDAQGRASGVSSTYEETIYDQYGNSCGTQTVDNSEYTSIMGEISRITEAIRNIEREISEIDAAISKITGVVSPTGVVPEFVDTTLVEEAIANRKIPLEELPKGLREFLEYLREQGLTDVVVFGGAVRDIFFGLEPADIDVSFKVRLVGTEPNDLRPSRAGLSQRVFRVVSKKLGELAARFDVAERELVYPSSAGKTASFRGKDVHYAGPIEVTKRDGSKMFMKRFLADSHTQGVYSSTCSAGILQIGIDCEGNLYGDLSALEDLLRGEARFSGDEMNVMLGDVLRLLRLKHQFGLKISDRDYETIKRCIAKGKEAASADTKVIEKWLEAMSRQCNIVSDTAKNRAEAQRDLDGLGITDLIEEIGRGLKEQDPATRPTPEKKAGPVAKKPTGEYRVYGELSVSDGKAQGEVAEVAGKMELLNGTIVALSGRFKYDVLATIDAIRIVDNIGAKGVEQRAEEIKTPYASFVEEEDGRRILLLDKDALENAAVLELVLHHELAVEAMITLIPYESEAVRELTANYLSLNYGLEMIMGQRLNLDDLRAILPQLGADEQFFGALSELARISRERANISDEDIMAVAVEYMRVMSYYEDLFDQFSFTGEWREKIKDDEGRYKSAIEIFSRISEAKAIVAKVKNSEAMLGNVTDGFVKTDEIVAEEAIAKPIKKVKMLVSGLTVKGLGIVDALIASNTGIILDVDELSKPGNAHIVAWLKSVTAGKSNIPIVYISKKGVSNVNEFLDINGLSQGAIPEGAKAAELLDTKNLSEQSGDRWYVAMPYSISGIYIAAQVAIANGDINTMRANDNLALTTIESMYESILGRKLETKDLENLFTAPWIVLPDVASAGAILDALHLAIGKIESAA